ncbi:RNA polymerase sigma factor [Pseudomaricurvus alkylphenolicus]|jgi:RNA polymerase sigma-70 factor (ECF subfamily)|uniref:RNA polymerase sigma factor n=1 Tax=Pseudomaricurvus alkylphenolicus TaxID=1306991 RepID=UPI00141F59B8|nr:RNA polymerase sigma factor [Pseudomaricurvus alkylphenolicus]NIB41837.1 RNA polymerase sigma factor [Pseudomaricurvus alkylphenolicus]
MTESDRSEPPQTLPIGERGHTIEATSTIAATVTELHNQEKVWTDLYNAHKAELVNYIKGQWQRSDDEAQDIAHQAFERLLCLPDPGQVEKPRAYLFQLARNLLIDECRRDKVKRERQDTLYALSQQEDLRSPESCALQRQQLTLLQEAIERLPAKRQQAFVLSRVHQLSYREIAEEMNISTEGVKKHVMRALDACHEFLSRDTDRGRARK